VSRGEEEGSEGYIQAGVEPPTAVVAAINLLAICTAVPICEKIASAVSMCFLGKSGAGSSMAVMD
jgi:hypothetical protein